MKNARVIEVHTLDEAGTEHGNPQGQTHLFFLTNVDNSGLSQFHRWNC